MVHIAELALEIGFLAGHYAVADDKRERHQHDQQPEIVERDGQADQTQEPAEVDGVRVKRYGPLSTMVVVDRLVGTFEPALLMVTTAHASSASAKTNTIAPSQPAGRSAGRNGKGTSQLSASPAMTASPHASGGRIMT